MSWRDRDGIADYMNEEPYATRVKAMLKKLGLPLPKPEEIFRGTEHDMLFLNSHGVVLKIGPTNVTDLMNPAILQPLGWLEDQKLRINDIPLAITVYPGIELFNDYNEKMNPPGLAGNIREIFTATKQHSHDIGDKNNGIIRILDEDGKELAVEVLLDADNKRNDSSPDAAAVRSAHMTRAKFLENRADIISEAVRSFSGATADIEYWQRAFEVHQPLRRLFWNAFSDTFDNGKEPDIKARQKFWTMCAQVTNNPQTATVPTWRSETRHNGEVAFVRDQTVVPQLILYRPWTGEAADKVIPPINVSDTLREAVQKKYSALIQKEGRELRVQSRQRQADGRIFLSADFV